MQVHKKDLPQAFPGDTQKTWLPIIEFPNNSAVSRMNIMLANSSQG